MIAHGHEEVEEELATLLHLDSHSAASLEGVSASNDEREIMSTKLGVAVRCVGICESGRGEDGRDLDTRLKSLLAKGKSLQFVEAVAICCTTEMC